LTGYPVSMADVFFCNLCDQSVPVSDLDSGAALRRGERTLCPSCREILKGVNPSRSGGGQAGVFLGLLALAGVLFLHLRSQDSQDDLRQEGEATRLALRGELESSLVTRLNNAKEKVREDIGLVSARGEALSRQLMDIENLARQEFAQLQDDIKRLEAVLAEQDALAKRIARSEATLSVIDERQRDSRRSLETFRDQVDLLALQIRENAKRPPSASGEGDSFTPQVAGLLKQLQNTDEKERLDALDKLSSQADLRLVPHVLPLLADPYEFNRFYAAKTLGEWGAKAAVPYLIEALLDEMSFVRQASLQALHHLTGQNFRFDHQGDPQGQKNQVALEGWRTWWAANGKGFLGG
jgi:hypothetical protein